jgi:hypothetical protein
MTNTLAWLLFALGVGHLIYGSIKFKTPLIEAASAGWVGQFSSPEIRRTAFWFLIFGPLLMLAGHTAVHAVAVGDAALFKMVGAYALVTSVVGVAALPKSPFWAALLISSLMLACSYGLL